MFCRTLFALCLAAVLAPVAMAQDLELREILAGTVAPVTVNLKDLDSTWRRIGVSSGSEGGNPLAALSAIYGGAFGSSTFYTLGRTVKIGSDTYMVAYRAASKPLDPSFLRSGEPPKPEKLRPDTKLWLCMLNLRTSGSILDIRAFDLEQEIKESSPKIEVAVREADGDQTKALGISSLSNLKQLGLGIMMYSQDYDEVLPPMKSQGLMKQAIMPYVKNEGIFIQSGTKTPYQPNPILHNKRMAVIASPAQFVLAYEQVPLGDGTRGVVFVDGHAKRIQESEWPKLKKASKIP